LSGSSQVLPVATVHQWELPQGPTHSTEAKTASEDSKDADKQLLLEMEELDQLESVFSIPSLANIFEQETIQQLVQAWCKHVKIDAGPRGIQHSIRITTVSPFKLMQLPYLFQDLLQRYV